ncbi:hypothetical protein Tco_0493399 [Tanacetum coccineum]
METLHLSFQRVVDAGMFHGIKLGGTLNLSHMFYADDAVFVGEWSDNNIATLVHVLDCFHKVSGLKINMNKSKLMGTHVDHDKVTRAANKLGCQILKAPFLYLGSYVGGNIAAVWNVLYSFRSLGNRFDLNFLMVIDGSKKYKVSWFAMGVRPCFKDNGAWLFRAFSP